MRYFDIIPIDAIYITGRGWVIIVSLLFNGYATSSYVELDDFPFKIGDVVVVGDLNLTMKGFDIIRLNGVTSEKIGILTDL